MEKNPPTQERTKTIPTSIQNYPTSKHIFTDGSKTDSAVGAAATSTTHTLTKKLCPDFSIFSAEATALDLSLEIVEKSNQSHFLILYDSLSCLKALQRSTDTLDPLILKILLKTHALAEKGKILVFAWLPSHVGIEGNEQADAHAKKALDLPLVSKHKVTYIQI